MTVVLVAAVLGGGVWWLTQGGGPGAGSTPEATAVPPPLPAGPLQLLSANVDDVQFLATDQVSKSGDVVQATVLDVGKTASSISRRYAFEAKRESVDCKARRIGDEVAGYYDQSGKLVTHELQSGALGRPASGIDAEVAVVCAPPAAHARIAPGWKAVQREVQVAPDDLAARAKAAPTDPELWAWVCANGVRGHWSPSLPTDCDRAVQLNPTSTATLLDRAFLKLTLRHIPQAQADFAKAIAMDPNNAEALYGRDLARVIGGDRAGSKADRDHARALDPKVVEWIERNYRDFQVSEPYRSH
ncbi:MAG: hypothetical protein JSR98_10600 [Proteobacteria bacterium]|nr:hypothetical protein [Pseudomonadota bacterium]